jgi:site-specific recombinase XerD
VSQPKSEQGIRLRLVARSTLDRDVTAFLVDRQARGLSTGTVEFYAKKLRYLQAYLERRGVQHVQDATPPLLREYILDLSKHLNPGGVHCAFRAMRTFFRWYESEHEPAGWSNPIHKVKAPRLLQQALDPVSVSDLKAMLATCQRHTFAGDRDRALLLSLLDTGCRASEFLSLDVGDVNMSTGAVIIRHGKGGKFRTAFMGASTRREVLRYLRHRADARGPLWTTAGGKRLTHSGLRQLARRRAVKAGVPVPSPHSFRRAFCLAMLRGGADILSISRILGHADVSLVARYAKQVQDDLQAVHARASPVDRML